MLSLGTLDLLLPYLWKTCYLEINEFEEKLPIPLSWSFVEFFMIKNFDSWSLMKVKLWGRTSISFNTWFNLTCSCDWNPFQFFFTSPKLYVPWTKHFDFFFWISDLYFFMHWCNILYCKKWWLTRVVGTGAWAFLIEFFLLFVIGYICKPCVSKISNPLLLLAVVGYEGILFYIFWCVNMQWKVMMLYGYK